MNIHDLVRQFSGLKSAVVGRGPKHPTDPNRILESDIIAFLECYPFLEQDREYIEFLQCYAGAWIDSQPDEELVIGLLGFDLDVTSSIANPDEGSPVDERGFLMFYDGLVRINAGRNHEEVIGQTFAFDSTGKRRWGIYRSISDSNGISDYYWYCKTFQEWFEVIIRTHGRVPDVLEDDF